MTDNGLAALARLRGIAREAEATLADNGADRPMTTAALQAKVRLRRAWFEAHPNQPAPEARAEVEALFAAIEAEAVADERERIATLRAALDGLVEAAMQVLLHGNVRPFAEMSREQLRAALAAAKETP